MEITDADLEASLDAAAKSKAEAPLNALHEALSEHKADTRTMHRVSVALEVLKLPTLLGDASFSDLRQDAAAFLGNYLNFKGDPK